MNESFKNVTSRFQSQTKIPVIFDENPILKEKMIHYCKTNINNLTCESIHSWILDEAIPMLTKDRLDDDFVELLLMNTTK